MVNKLLLVCLAVMLLAGGAQAGTFIAPGTIPATNSPRPAILATFPDERDRPTRHIPAIPEVRDQKTVVRSANVIISPAPPDYIFPPQFELSPPWQLLHLMWDPIPDAASYKVQSTPNFIDWYWVTDAPTPEAYVPIHLSREFYRILSVDTNGLNELGYYEPLP